MSHSYPIFLCAQDTPQKSNYAEIEMFKVTYI